MEQIELRDVHRKRTQTVSSADQRWYDVQDEEGNWRVGFCQKRHTTYKLISLDGFHPSYATFYCEHSGKILPVRSKTMGLTVPEEKTIRRVLRLAEIEQICGKISLFQLIKNQLENTPQKIRLFLRTELLIFIDKIFTTPFEILATIKMIDIHINKLFMYVIEYYFKLFEDSKRFISLCDANSTAKELYKATYEMAVIMQMVLGVHKRSRPFYQSQANRTIKCEAIFDYFIKYEGGGILPFKLFFKTMGTLKVLEIQDVTIYLETVYFFISIWEKYQFQLIEGKAQSHSCIIMDDIISLIENLCNRSEEIAKYFKGKLQLVSRIETLYFKLFDKECSLRKFVMRDRQKEKETINQLVNPKPHLTRIKSEWQLGVSRSILARSRSPPKDKQKQKLNQVDNQKIKQMEDKIAQLQQNLSKMQAINIHDQQVVVQGKEGTGRRQPVENLGEEAFLGSLEWALDAGDLATCKKLVTWRRSLLKLGRITGWQIALAVAIKTFKSKQINTEDIIEANYDFISKSMSESD